MESQKTILTPSTKFIQEVYYGESLDMPTVDAVADKLNEPERAVEYVATWLADKMGVAYANDYFKESPYSHKEIMQAYDACNSNDTIEQWQGQYGKWLAYRPNLGTRFNQAVTLLDAERKLQKAYPEVTLSMVPVNYLDIAHNTYPHYSPSDTHTRLDKPHNKLAALYSGEVVVESALLTTLRGLDVPVGQVRYQKTVYSSLHNQANTYANCGLMLVSDNLYSIDTLRTMRDITGVNTRSAGLAEGIALASQYKLPVDTAIGFPKPLPNTNGLFCGVNVEREFINDPHRDYPRLYFRLWPDAGTPNCLLAVTA